MQIVYRVRKGEITEHELVNETPRGFRVKCKMIEGTRLLVAGGNRKWSSTGITTLNKQEAKEFARSQLHKRREWLNAEYTELNKKLSLL